VYPALRQDGLSLAPRTRSLAHGHRPRVSPKHQQDGERDGPAEAAAFFFKQLDICREKRSRNTAGTPSPASVARSGRGEFSNIVSHRPANRGHLYGAEAGIHVSSPHRIASAREVFGEQLGQDIRDGNTRHGVQWRAG